MIARPKKDQKCFVKMAAGMKPCVVIEVYPHYAVIRAEGYADFLVGVESLYTNNVKVEQLGLSL